MGFHANFGLPRPFCSRVRSKHATNRQRTDRHRPSFYNAPSYGRQGIIKSKIFRKIVANNIKQCTMTWGINICKETMSHVSNAFTDWILRGVLLVWLWYQYLLWQHRLFVLGRYCLRCSPQTRTAILQILHIILLKITAITKQIWTLPHLHKRRGRQLTCMNIKSVTYAVYALHCLLCPKNIESKECQISFLMLLHFLTTTNNYVKPNQFSNVAPG